MSIKGNDLPAFCEKLHSFEKDNSEISNISEFCINEICSLLGLPLGHGFILNGANGGVPKITSETWCGQGIKASEKKPGEIDLLNINGSLDLFQKIKNDVHLFRIFKKTDAEFSLRVPAVDPDYSNWALIPVSLGNNRVLFFELFSDRPVENDQEFINKLSFLALTVSQYISQAAYKRRLVNREDKFTKLFNKLNDAAIITDGKQIISYNKKAETIFGLNESLAEKITIQKLFFRGGILDKYNQQSFDQQMSVALAGENAVYQGNISDKLQDLIDVSICLVPFTEDNNRYVHVIVKDRSTVIKTEKLFKKNSELYFQFFENSPIGMVVLDVELNVLNANSAFQNMFGYSKHEIEGNNLNEFIIPDSEKALSKSSTETAFNGKTFSLETVREDKFGLQIPVYIGGGPVKVDGEIEAIFGIYVDLREHKWAESQIKELYKELETKVKKRTQQLSMTNKELEAFSYSVSHDLRAPLRSIDGFSLALLEDYDDLLDETGKNYLMRVRKAAQKMSSYIDGMISFSKVTRAPFTIKEVDLSKIAHSIFTVLNKDNEERNIELKIQPGMTDYADPVLIEIVLQNLLENAWKYTSKEEKAIIEFGKTDSFGLKGYYIKDNGVGFDQKYEDKLFIPFQRLHSNSEFNGSGIGLATAKRIIHRHNGIITADGVKGEGATFYFTLNAK